MAGNQETHVEWRWMSEGRSFDSETSGWTVTELSGLRAPVEYSPTSIAGRDGSSLGMGKRGGLQPKVTLAYGNEDPENVAWAVKELVNTVKQGGQPNMMLAIKPLGFKSKWRTVVACGACEVSYSHRGRMAEVALQFYSTSPTWNQLGGDPAEEGMTPW